MKPEWWHQIQNLVQLASECDESQRAAFLREACAGDDALQHEVESFLALEKDAKKFLERPATQEVAGELPETMRSWIGRSIGSCQIVSFISEGGMGEVYLGRYALHPRV